MAKNGYLLGRLAYRLSRTVFVEGSLTTATFFARAQTSPCNAIVPAIADLMRLGKGHVIADLMEELPASVDSIPMTLPIDEQGSFSLGWYHEAGSERICLAPNCSQALGKANRSGYCKAHIELSPHRKQRRSAKYRNI